VNDSAALRVAIDIQKHYRRFYIYRNAQRSAAVVDTGLNSDMDAVNTEQGWLKMKDQEVMDREVT